MIELHGTPRFPPPASVALLISPMAMQLSEDVPAMLALFLTGIVGYLAAKRFSRPVRAPKQAKQVVEDFDEVENDAALPTETTVRELPAKESQTPAPQQALRARRRSTKKHSTTRATMPEATPAMNSVLPKADNQFQRPDEASDAGEVRCEVVTEEALGVTEEACVATETIHISPEQEQATAAKVEVPAEMEVEPDEAPVMSEKVKKLLAKKALRKARKAEERQRLESGCAAGVEEDAKPSPVEVPEQPEEAQCLPAVSDSKECDHPAILLPEPQAEFEPRAEQEEHHVGRWANWEEETEELEEEEYPQQQVIATPEGTDDWELEWSEGSEDWPEDVPTPPSTRCSSWNEEWNSSSKAWKWQDNRSKSWSKSSWKEELPPQDGWMIPFDDLIARPASTPSPVPALPAGPAVCLWKGSDASDDGTFTDGQQVYQPVHCGNGQQLYTDGDQYYMPVCVFVGTPIENAPPADDQVLEEPEFNGPTTSLDSKKAEAEDEPHEFDPYNPLGLSPQQVEASDAWDTCWG